MIMKTKWEDFDFCIFALLLLSVTFYQIQYLWPSFASFRIRELLYIYLYARIIFFYRPRISTKLLFHTIFIGLAILISIHTYFTYGQRLAISGFTRFVNVALLAPIASVLFINRVRLNVLFFIWGSVVLLGITTVVYQLSGGEINWLVRDYLAIRGDLLRHKSLLGEPNVGGMAAILLYVIAFVLIRTKLLRYFVICMCTFLIIVCLSKAAMLAFMIANTILLVYAILVSSANKIGAPRSFLINFLVVIIWGLTLMSNQTILNYGKVAVKSFTGELRGEPSALEDLDDRFITQRYGGAFMLEAPKVTELENSVSTPSKTGDPVLNPLALILLGGSFSVAGSSALELKVPNAVGPHNGYLEIFLVGGVFSLLLFLYMQWQTILALFRQTSTGSNVHFGLLTLFVLLSLFMAGYPTMYEPITGSLFWLIVGLSEKNLSIS